MLSFGASGQGLEPNTPGFPRDFLNLLAHSVKGKKSTFWPKSRLFILICYALLWYFSLRKAVVFA